MRVSLFVRWDRDVVSQNDFWVKLHQPSLKTYGCQGPQACCCQPRLAGLSILLLHCLPNVWIAHCKNVPWSRIFTRLCVDEGYCPDLCIPHRMVTGNKWCFCAPSAGVFVCVLWASLFKRQQGSSPRSCQLAYPLQHCLWSDTTNMPALYSCYIQSFISW